MAGACELAGYLPQRQPAALGAFPPQLAGKRDGIGRTLGIALAALDLDAARAFRSRAPFSLATVMALSNSAIAPSTWRISFAVGVSSRNEPGESAATRAWAATS